MGIHLRNSGCRLPYGITQCIEDERPTAAAVAQTEKTGGSFKAIYCSRTRVPTSK